MEVCTNPGFEVSTSGWTIAKGTETMSRDTVEHHSGVASGKCITPGGATQEGMYFAAAGLNLHNGDVVTVSAWLKGSGTVRLWAATRAAGLFEEIDQGPDLSLSDSWTLYTTDVTALGDRDRADLLVRTPTVQAITFYVDDASLLVPDVVTVGLRVTTSGLRW